MWIRGFVFVRKSWYFWIIVAASDGLMLKFLFGWGWTFSCDGEADRCHNVVFRRQTFLWSFLDTWVSLQHSSPWDGDCGACACVCDRSFLATVARLPWLTLTTWSYLHQAHSSPLDTHTHVSLCLAHFLCSRPTFLTLDHFLSFSFHLALYLVSSLPLSLCCVFARAFRRLCLWPVVYCFQ